jgi:rhodanese-related sulfurtransferase
VSLPAIITAETCDTNNRQHGYAGDIGAVEAWKLLEQKADAVLVDVRTPQEWEQIGLPDLASLGKVALRLSWMILPSGETNSQFVSEFSQLQVADDTPVLLLCRSGARSLAAAKALTQRGYSRCFNVAGGFEGPNGWKANQLPSKR